MPTKLHGLCGEERVRDLPGYYHPRYEQRSRIRTRRSERVAVGNLFLHFSYSQSCTANKPCLPQLGTKLIDNTVVQLV